MRHQNIKHQNISAILSKNEVSANNIIVDTSIKRQTPGQSTTVVKGCMYIMFDMVDTVFPYGRALIICYFLQESFKVNESSLHEI